MYNCGVGCTESNVINVYFMQSFREEVECLAATWDRLQREGEEWAEHLVPDEHLGELPSEESGFSSPGEIQD